MSKEKDMATYDTSAYEKLKKDYNKIVDTDVNNQVASAQSNAQSQLRQAYVNNIQNQRQVAQNMAMAGIRGGATESANVKLATAYGNQRASINSDLTNTINSINQTAMQNKNQYALETDSAKRQYIENRQAETRANKREDKQINYQRKTENYTAKYSKYYDVDKLKKLLKKASSKLEKQIINARIGFIRSQKHGY